MPFEIGHWKNPRKTIATRFEHNDIAYATHGAVLAMEALRAIDKPASELKQMRLLDYGCGTGRVARVLSKIFGEVYAYDPVSECLALARSECYGMDFPNLRICDRLDEIPNCDLAVCINVIEHLADQEAQVLVDNLKSIVAGPTYLWYASLRNKFFMEKYLTDVQIANDQTNTNDHIVIRPFYFALTE